MTSPSRKSSTFGDALGKLTGSRKWVSELAGTPTYLGAAFLTIWGPMNFLAGTVAFFCFVMVYHYIYLYLFPEFEFRGKWRRLGLFVSGQVLFWIVVLLLLIKRT